MPPPNPESSSLAGTPDGVKLIARDDRKNPLISTFDWTNDAAQRIFRVPAGFMRNKTQERIEELARERAAALAEGGVTIDLALVEEGIEFGKRMMAEMIATYPAQGTSPEGVTATRDSAGPSATATRSGYLNEANPPPSVAAERRASGEQRES